MDTRLQAEGGQARAAPPAGEHSPLRPLWSHQPKHVREQSVLSQVEDISRFVLRVF